MSMQPYAIPLPASGRGFWCVVFCVLQAVGACAQCPRAPVAEVPIRLVEGFPIIAARIGATPVSMVFDTGAEGDLLLPEAAEALGLRALPGLTTRMFGTGGARDVPTVLLEGVRLGGVALPAIATPVTALPALPRTEPAVAGLLGAPLLASYDVDLDVPHGRMGLYPAGACATPPAEMATMPLEVTAAREAFLTVRVNGQNLLALLDTGSRATLLTAAAARQLGVRAPVSANTARGVDGERLPLEHARVREMAVAADARRDVPVSVAPLQLGRADMLLGLDYLGQRRVWISYASGVLGIGVPRPGASGR